MHGQEVGDYMGVESCVDFRPELPPPTPSHGGGGRSYKRRSAAGKEFPPPIPPSHLAWGMRKYHRSDGRLVIVGEKMDRHGSFRARRDNGRLLLDLVPLEDGGAEDTEVHGEEDSGGDLGSGYPTVNGHECYKCNIGVAVRPCGGFGVAAAALRPPVHI